MVTNGGINSVNRFGCRSLILGYSGHRTIAGHQGALVGSETTHKLLVILKTTIATIGRGATPIRWWVFQARLFNAVRHRVF